MNKYVTLGEMLVAVLVDKQDGVPHYDVFAISPSWKVPFRYYNLSNAEILIGRFVPEPCREFLRWHDDKTGEITKRFLGDITRNKMQKMHEILGTFAETLDNAMTELQSIA